MKGYYNFDNVSYVLKNVVEGLILKGYYNFFVVFLG